MQRAPAPSPEALTLDQRQFAAEQHNLIYAYLNEKGLYHEEYYDIAAFGYLQAVKRYLSQPALRQYAFSTIAWRAMRQSIAAFHRSEERRKAAERAFAESQPVATDAWDALEGSLILHDLGGNLQPGAVCFNPAAIAGLLHSRGRSCPGHQPKACPKTAQGTLSGLSGSYITCC